MRLNRRFYQRLFVLLGSLAILWAMLVLVTGKVVSGEGRSAKSVTLAGNPGEFWATVVGSVVIGGAVIYVALKYPSAIDQEHDE